MKRQAPQLTRQEARIQIKQALASLTALQTVLGEKKFNRRLSKVEKILAGGLPKKKKMKQVLNDEVTAA